VGEHLPQVLKRQDVWAGLLFVAFGVAGLLLGADLPLGTARRMGPGYMPHGLSWLLIGVGALVTLRGSLHARDAVERMRLRPFLGVLAGGLAFALLIQPGGILVASAGAIAGAALADRESRWREVVLLAAIAMAFCAGVFVYLLGLPMPLWFR
jgi:hypothetical protein